MYSVSMVVTEIPETHGYRDPRKRLSVDRETLCGLSNLICHTRNNAAAWPKRTDVTAPNDHIKFNNNNNKIH